MVDQLELRRSIAALDESEQRYRLLFQGNPQPMWVYDVETYAFLDVNAAAEAMYGYTREEFLALTILDIRPTEDTDQVRGRRQSRVGGVARTGPWRHLRKDGSLLFVRISSYPTMFEGRRARLVLSNDISAEKHLEEQLVQAQKMEAIGQLAGGVAHDFNNLLTVINGYAQLLISRLHEADPLRVDAGHILQAGERAASLTQQLLAFSRRQVLQPRPLDVGGVDRRTCGRCCGASAARGHRGPHVAAGDAAAGDGRPGAARAGAAQPRHQRSRRDARRAAR